ncbi:MAG TPA: hypothetical protein VMS98_14365 [Thermoanaerobaculia bacterium]|nr:hypothetical protein [Thermoanaerobaculia bacterium]
MRKLTLLGVALVAGCASSSTVDLNEARRVVGTENSVRIDAQIFSERLSTNTRIRLTYDISNERSSPIAIADIIPETSYDADTQTVTIAIGSEVPGIQLLPRLLTIGPGEKKSFSTVARVNIVMARTATPLSRFPNALRLKMHFLNETEQFQQLIAIPERAIHDPKLADELFPKWLEKNETVYTNTLPMRWGADPPSDQSPQTPPGRRRGRSG